MSARFAGGREPHIHQAIFGKTRYLCALQNRLNLIMAYQYDVFISYKSKSRDWLRDVFLEPFMHFLEEEIGKDVRVFVDWHDLEPGDAWKQRLKKGLMSSKCLVSLLLPTYFESVWCKREFAVFEHRSRECGLSSLEDPIGLIIPISLHKGHRYPNAVKDMQFIDYKYFYSSNVEGYKKRKKYQKLQDEIKTLAEVVAKRVRQAPAWDHQWQSDEWLELSTEHLSITIDHVSSPRL